ncbi:hypothetical protein ID850_15705 [Xenorhabdus sp. Flor]|uniref:hypothetical protein n=1 Tax=Xenorhabdus cabanillasii TaxID=351673 RepID=UPI00198368F7|nr:hypothetical protein [Xenorhabdus sp. Flor]MBD2816164.1 hypothetical protein [Xenorhabdus sp. Flor]
MQATRTAGARDTVRYTEDEWLLQNLSYWLMAKLLLSSSHPGTTLRNDFKSKPNIQVAVFVIVTLASALFLHSSLWLNVKVEQ